jgi:hypothetical protein
MAQTSAKPEASMEIHSPEHPIRSLRDFLTHIATVTCGILIALGLEQLVERHHNHVLAAHAREDFGAELAENRTRVEAALASDKTIAAWLDANIAYGDGRLKHAKATQDPTLEKTPTRLFLVLPSSAWDVGLATQAVNQLGFAEARALSRAYNRQATLNGLEAVAREQWLSVARWQGSDTDKLSDAELVDLLRDLRVADAYAYALAGLEASVLENYAKATASLVAR